MALLWQSGAELQSATALMEVDSVTGTPSISTTIKRSGNAAWRFNASGSATYFQHQYSAGSDAFYSAWFYFASFPGANAIIFRLWDGAAGQYIQISSTGVLEFFNGAGVSLGTTSALSTGVWYNLQIAGTDTPGLQEARLNGVVIGTTGTGYSGTSIRVGVQSAVTMDMYVDDIIINDDLGSNETSYPNMDARVIHLKPNGAGDSNTWEHDSGGAGDANNYTEVYETTPDGATSYIVRDTAVSNQPKDLYAMESPSLYGIEPNDKIIAVATGARIGSTSNTSAAGRNGNVGIKAGGTEAWSGSVDWSINGWRTHADPVPRIYKYVAYVDPSDSAAWSYTKLESIQAGVRANSSATTDVRVSTVWLSVQYISKGSFFRMF